MNYNLDGLTKEEGRIYISEKMKGADYSHEVFNENAVEAILNRSGWNSPYHKQAL